MFIVYGKKNCPYCLLAQQDLDNAKIEYVYADISDWDEKRKSDLKNLTGMKTVPIILRLVGGYSDLQQLVCNPQDRI